MKREFTRFEFGRFRTLIGTLELLGGMGLLVGFRWPPLLWISSAGLSLLMLCGVGVRIRIGDGFARSLPALVLMIVNAYIFIESLRLPSSVRTALHRTKEVEGGAGEGRYD